MDYLTESKQKIADIRTTAKKRLKIGIAFILVGTIALCAFTSIAPDSAEYVIFFGILIVSFIGTLILTPWLFSKSRLQELVVQRYAYKAAKANKGEVDLYELLEELNAKDEFKHLTMNQVVKYVDNMYADNKGLDPDHFKRQLKLT